ncbi:MAG: hypothetical protein AAFP81_17415 [Pseudomonadota bacterium]
MDRPHIWRDPVVSVLIGPMPLYASVGAVVYQIIRIELDETTILEADFGARSIELES